MPSVTINKTNCDVVSFRIDDMWDIVFRYQEDGFRSTHLAHSICPGNCNHKIPLNIIAMYEKIDSLQSSKYAKV